jgi:hypothetical protein
MQLRRAKWSSPRAIFRLLLLRTRTCRCCRQLQTPWRIQLSRDVSTVEKRATMLMCAPNCNHTPIECRQPTHVPIEVQTLFLWPLSRTLLEEESTKWWMKKLMMPQWLLHYSSTHIALWSFLDLLSFLHWESRDEVPLKGVVLSHPKILNFGMWLKFTNFF